MIALNEFLINQQGLNEADVAELQVLHQAREDMFEVMETLDPDIKTELVQLQMFVVLLESLEYNMQRVWKFEQDASKHSWWYRAPHCTCPKMDNADPLMGRGGRIINGNCPLHGGKIIK